MRSQVVSAALASVVTLCVINATGAQDKPPVPKATNLLVEKLPPEFAVGREVIMDVLEVPADTVMAPHWHPGEEYQYVLEGEVEVTINGAEPKTMKAGEGGRIPYKAVHSARTYALPAKVVVFRIHTSGLPVRYAATDKL